MRQQQKMTKEINRLWIQVAQELADRAGGIARSYFRKDPQVTLKEGLSPVTAADLAIERAMRDLLQQYLPSHGILGEEYGMTQSQDSRYLWVLDPIDGTTSFACGKPTFCTLIALLEDDKPILGIIDQPITRERWLGLAGERSQFNGAYIPEREAAVSQELRLACTTPAMFKTDEEKTKWQEIQRRASVISYGGDAYNYGLLALGCLDLICEADLKFYDVAALIPIIEGAGGRISDWQGQALRCEGFKGQVLAART
jgi:myo-inositol-1(or 4)-monophosphatase